jgi:hypothetical protein
MTALSIDVLNKLEQQAGRRDRGTAGQARGEPGEDHDDENSAIG